MIEGFAREMSENDMFEAILFGHAAIRKSLSCSASSRAKIGVEKAPFVGVEDTTIYDRLKSRFYDEFKSAKQTSGKQSPGGCGAPAQRKGRSGADSRSAAEGRDKLEAFLRAWHDLEERVVRDLILSGTRPMAATIARCEISSGQVDVLPRVHGSAVFQRGETQALITVVLGTHAR